LFLNKLRHFILLAVLPWRSMNKSDLALELACQQKTTPGEAADKLDQAVSQVLRKLRHGNPARLPGLGTISADKSWTFKPERKSK
jgi:nucleoid DNA-binding protein